jgi:uncharacterized membrane protein YsdA (DUF1294 family)/cold shock CspA family protein
MARVQANIVEWFDEKGYGFARLIGGKDRIFVHAKSLGKGLSRLKKGDELELEVIKGRNGRPAAKDVKLLDAKALAKQLPYHLYTAAILLLSAQLLFILGKAPFFVLVTYSIMSLFSILLYRRDKYAAQYGWRRISETQLLGVDLFGGVIGGLIAQARYRHKTSKYVFQARVFIIVIIHSIILALFGLGII